MSEVLIVLVGIAVGAAISAFSYRQGYKHGWWQREQQYRESHFFTQTADSRFGRGRTRR